MRELSRQVRGAGLRVGLVPTMGFLHEGHLELVRRAKADADVVVVSIFVNPAQFNDPGDFENYPRDISADEAMLEAEGVDMMFVPEAEQVYPPGSASRVIVSGLADTLCGPGRPGHFDGVATVVSALFNMVEPDFAVFGEKDYQQLQVIRRMAADLHFGVDVVSVATCREPDGVAMSTRNERLSAAERQQAPAIYRGLCLASDAWQGGEDSSQALVGLVASEIEAAEGMTAEYVSLVDGATLQPVPRATAGCVLAVAAALGPVRLIDNVVLQSTASAVTAADNEETPAHA